MLADIWKSYLLHYIPRFLGRLKGGCIYVLSEHVGIHQKNRKSVDSRVELLGFTFYLHQLEAL